MNKTDEIFIVKKDKDKIITQMWWYE